MNNALSALLVANAVLTSNPWDTRYFLKELMELKPASESRKPSVKRPLVLILLKKNGSTPSKSWLLIMAQLARLGSRC